MGRHRLEVPNAPIRASIPAPQLAHLKTRYAVESPGALSWPFFISRLLALGEAAWDAGTPLVEAAESDGTATGDGTHV